MTIITTKLTVAADGKISAADSLPPGDYLVEIRAQDAVTLPSRTLRIEDWPKLDLTPRNPHATFSREEIYGDDMR